MGPKDSIAGWLTQMHDHYLSGDYTGALGFAELILTAHRHGRVRATMGRASDYYGPGGVHTLDPTIKKSWVDSIGANYAILQKLNMIKPLYIGAWVNDSYVRQTYKELGLD